MPRRIIIDTDPGIDDAVAILLALATPEELEVLGIVAVAGNLPLVQTERNARRVCELAGRAAVPVYAGCERPILRPLATAEHIHRETARDRLLLPEPTIALQAQHGVDFFVETLRAAEAGTITVCALGPLTNIAMALVKAPEITGRIGELVVMGGACFKLGNVTPTAEFNIHVDPHAAAAVFESGITITMLPLDVTHQLLTTGPRRDALRALGNRCGQAVAALLASFERNRRAKFGTRATALHDPSVIAYLLSPTLFQGREVNVAVETQSSLTMGMTVVDWWGVTGRKPNVRMMNTVDADGFFDLLTEKLARLP
ncbi:MAG TPA: nucleoside hydrolase [Stellaceae bacterium]|jgi:purine nucleosidase|nr:nucleoside hydrolase [Stellaceae bacterium]